MNLHDWLVLTDKTAAAFERDLKLSPGTLNRYKAGLRKPEWGVMLRIAKATSGQVLPTDFITTADWRRINKPSKQ